MTEFKPAEVEIDLGGQPLTLRCTLDAAMSINTAFGGLAIAHQRVQSMDLDSMATVIRYGAGMDAVAAKDLRARIFAAGIAGQMAPLTRFIVYLIAGGKEAAKEGEAPKGEAGGS